eukprot:TRINITY_DN5519_c0_g1_i1.p1 TRINITY_DN5519_c0_g1~~TRINITY_DN5519_c0_g1_i1.p1  ORF type:complete len:1585 (+),score=286.70 TRINITY_DN5519_c0_g1_i1:58-4755(+)
MASARQSLGADPVSKASLLQALDPEGALTADLGQAQTLRRGGGAPSGREHLTLDHASKLAAVQDAKSCLAQEETRLHELKRQVAAGVPVDPKRLGFQEHEVSQAWAVLTEAEKRLDAAELQQERVAQATSNNAARARQDAGLRAVAARQLQVDEVHRSTRIVESDLDARAEAQERRRLESEEQQRRAGEAKFHRTLGKRRLKEAQDTRNVAKIEGELIRDDKFSHDAQRVLNLKSSIEKINNNMQASNESRKKKQQKKDAENERRKNDLLEQGLNPYEVFRREDIEADKQRQVRETEERNALRSEKLLEQLMEDDKRYKRKIKQEKQKRMHDEEFQRQMGNYARERRVVAYIKEMTIGNVEVLDPTGAALRIDPSKVTVQRTHAFGLGKVSIDEIKKVGRDVKTGHAVLERHRQRLARISGQESDEDEPAAAADAGAKLSEAAALMQDEDEEALPEGKLWVPKLTELEKQYLAAARERQKQNMTSVQRCWGKEFKGDAFLAKPSVIAFDDFEVGKKYRQIVEITNVSYTFNQFKLLPLDDRVQEFFEIEFVPPGRMSAGVTRFVTIWFHPKVSKDINTTFPILAKTGKIDFPMRCTTKKTILTITPQDADASPSIDFGQVLDGEVGERILYVKNTGALPATFTFEPSEDANGFLEMITRECSEQEFIAHATTKVKFIFKPTRLGDFNAVLRLKIDNHAIGDASYVKEMFVNIKGSCTDVPIWVEKPEYNLKICLFNHIFRENIMLHNRQSTAMKVVVESPKLIEGELQLTPTLAFIQGQSEQAIQVKFCPKEDFLDKHPEFRDKQSKTHGAFRIPVKIVGADQVLPVETALVGTLSPSTVRFEPKYLDFGRCFVGASSVLRMTVINESLLPQDFALPRLPSFVSVMHVPSDVTEEEAKDGKDTGTAVLEGGGSAQFGSLLPQERKVLCVTYTPEAATEMKHKMSFKAITGSLCATEYNVLCKGQGVPGILRLSHSQIEMASIPCDVTSTESVAITNTSKVPQMMNLLVPPALLSCLHVSPVCSVLQPGESQQLQIEFKPTLAYKKLLEPPEVQRDGDAEPAPDEDGGGGGGGGDTIDPAKHRIETLRAIRTTGGRRWEAPVYLPTVTPSEDGETANSLGNTVHASWRLSICVKSLSVTSQEQAERTSSIYLGVRTCVLPTKIVASPASVDAGEVTTGQSKIIPIILQNMVPSEHQELQMEALPENACFSVLNAPRAITEKPFTMLVQFKPETAPQIYQSMLSLKTGNTRLQVPLSGRGVRPVLKIEPEDGIIHLGSVVYGQEGKEFTTAKVDILNDSKFDMHYNLRTVIASEQCHAGPSPFTLSPAVGVVGPNGKQEVTITFRPHRPCEVFREKIFVDVPMQKEKTFLYLYGHCFHYQAYCIPGMEFSPFGRADVTPTGAFVDALALGVGSGSTPDQAFSFPSAQRKNISVVFERGELSKFVLIGAGAPVGTNGITCDIQILPSNGGRDFSKYFTVEAPEGGKADKVVNKVAIVSGKPAIKAVFRYTPPETSSLTCGGVALDMLAGIGQWISCSAKCLITGGAMPAGSPATQEIMIELSAYLQQI